MVPEINVVVIEPAYQINLGYIARISKNFGVKSIALVNPKCKTGGKNAIKYSKHGIDLLKKARVCSSLHGAVAGTFALGSTGIWRKTGGAQYNIYRLDRVASILERNGIKRISVVLGRESTGLSPEELSECDANLFVPADGTYPILNISHALAVILYELTRKKGRKTAFHVYANESEILNTMKLFKMMIKKRGLIRNEKAVTGAFNHVLRRANPTKRELNAIAAALSGNRQK